VEAHDDGAAGFGLFGQQFHYRDLVAEVEVVGGFVGEPDVGALGQCCGQGDALAFTA